MPAIREITACSLPDISRYTNNISRAEPSDKPVPMVSNLPRRIPAPPRWADMRVWGQDIDWQGSIDGNSELIRDVKITTRVGVGVFREDDGKEREETERLSKTKNQLKSSPYPNANWEESDVQTMRGTE